MKLSHLSDTQLVIQTKEYVKREREITLVVLQHLREIEDRRLFASEGYSTLFEYAMKVLGYDRGAAQRRVDAMRLLCIVPDGEKKILEGELTFTHFSQAQSFFKREDFSDNQKRALMSEMEGLSVRESLKLLLNESSEPEKHLHETVKPVTATINEVKLYLSDEQLKKLERLQELLGGSLSEVVERVAELGLQKLDPEKQVSRSSAPNPDSRRPTAAVTREVWKRDEGRCAWVHPENGRRCTSRYRLELDHKKPWAYGGTSSAPNLRLLCFHHNQLEAEKAFGRPTMRKFRP